MNQFAPTILYYLYFNFCADDNRIFSWGNSNSGQLGIGDTKTTVQPHLVQLGVTPGTRIKGVTCGTRHTFIWTEQGECFSFGNNFSAQLGYDFQKPDFKENQVRDWGELLIVSISQTFPSPSPSPLLSLSLSFSLPTS